MHRSTAKIPGACYFGGKIASLSLAFDPRGRTRAQWRFVAVGRTAKWNLRVYLKKHDMCSKIQRKFVIRILNEVLDLPFYNI